MNETLRVEIDLEVDASKMKKLLRDVRSRLAEIYVIEGISCVTAKQFNKRRGIWLTYGWGVGEGNTEIWMPLKQSDEGLTEYRQHRNVLHPIVRR